MGATVPLTHETDFLILLGSQEGLFRDPALTRAIVSGLGEQITASEFQFPIEVRLFGNLEEASTDKFVERTVAGVVRCANGVTCLSGGE